MRTHIPFILLVTFFGFSCSHENKASSDRSETLQLTSETMRKFVDLELSKAIWTDEQRGRKNEEWVVPMKQLASARKNVDFEDLSSVEAHVSTLGALEKKSQGLALENLFDRIYEYLAACQSDPQHLPLLKVEVSNIEYRLVEHWMSQLAIKDCCFPTPMKVQANKEVAAGELFEMVVFPDGDMVLGEGLSYMYEDVYIQHSGDKVPIKVDSRQIGHVFMLQFTPENSGEYVVRLSVTQTGDYLAEPWKQDFEWPVEIR